MSFDDDEGSVSDSEPIELYEVVLPSAIYRLARHETDVTYDGHTWIATPIGRANMEIVGLGKVRELKVSIPIDHPLAVNLLWKGISPITSTVTIVRLQVRSGEARRVWRGNIARLETNGPLAMLSIPGAVDQAFAVRLPVVAASRTCNHALYDAGCKVDRPEWTAEGNGGAFDPILIDAIDGNTITLSAINRPDHWADFGEVVREVDGERRSVIEQVGLLVRIDIPFRDLAPGDVVKIYAGCGKTIVICRDKFGNVPNFGGHPHLPTKAPQAPSGHGVVVQQ